MKKKFLSLHALIIVLLSASIGVAGIFYYYQNNNSPSIPNVPFYFIRHGQTDYNIKKIVAGKLDTPLNETGIAQAQAATKILEKTDIQRIITSPLQRARVTAEIISKVLHKPIIMMDELVERSAGSFEGKPEGAWLLKWIYDVCRIPDAERYSVFKERVIAGLQKALRLPGPVLIVAHGGVFDVLQNFLQLNHDEHIENATPVFIAPTNTNNPSWYYKYLSKA